MTTGKLLKDAEREQKHPILDYCEQTNFFLNCFFSNFFFIHLTTTPVLENQMVAGKFSGKACTVVKIPLDTFWPVPSRTHLTVPAVSGHSSGGNTVPCLLGTMWIIWIQIPSFLWWCLIILDHLTAASLNGFTYI